MKRFFTLFLIIILLLTGCNSKTPVYSEHSNKLKITVTVFPLYDIARNIAGDFADITLLGSFDNHSHEPSPQDIITIRESEIFLYIGGESDMWTEKIISENNVNMVKLFDFVNLAENNHNHNEYDLYDEHIWTSPRNAIRITETIREALCNADPENTETYKNNEEAFIEKLSKLDELYSNIIENAKRNVIIFGDRFPFRYLCDDYGLEYFAAFPNCTEEAEPDAKMLASLIERIKADEIPVVFYGEFSDMKTALAISRETGAEPLLLHSCHNVTQEELGSGTGYIELMQKNAENLRFALN